MAKTSRAAMGATRRAGAAPTQGKTLVRSKSGPALGRAGPGAGAGGAAGTKSSMAATASASNQRQAAVRWWTVGWGLGPGAEGDWGAVAWQDQPEEEDSPLSMDLEEVTGRLAALGMEGWANDVLPKLASAKWQDRRDALLAIRQFVEGLAGAEGVDSLFASLVAFLQVRGP
jgi:hypothetical protein